MVRIPLGSYPISHGTLAICAGSHLLSGYDATGAVYESKQELPTEYQETPQTVWVTTAVEPGDIILFDIRTIHCSTWNETDRFRISIDTRWKPTQKGEQQTTQGFHVL